MGVSKTTVHCWIVGSTIHVHSTEENKVARLLMELHFRYPVDLTKYRDMLDQIHLDKKWFFLTQKKEIYLILTEEENQNCCIKHKSHITKVMFLCAVVRPRFNPSARCGMERWGYGQLVTGNWQKVNLKIDQEEHWFGTTKQ